MEVIKKIKNIPVTAEMIDAALTTYLKQYSVRLELICALKMKNKLMFEQVLRDPEFNASFDNNKLFVTCLRLHLFYFAYALFSHSTFDFKCNQFCALAYCIAFYRFDRRYNSRVVEYMQKTSDWKQFSATLFAIAIYYNNHIVVKVCCSLPNVSQQFRGLHLFIHAASLNNIHAMKIILKHAKENQFHSFNNFNQIAAQALILSLSRKKWAQSKDFLLKQHQIVGMAIVLALQKRLDHHLIDCLLKQDDDKKGIKYALKYSLEPNYLDTNLTLQELTQEWIMTPMTNE